MPFGLNMPGVDDSGAHFTRDRLVMVWQSAGDIYYATRPSALEAFTTRTIFASTPANEFEPMLREDGCEVFFVRGAGDSADIYSISIAP